MNELRLTLSIVSHGQRDLVCALLRDLDRNVRTPLCAILTENIPESSFRALPSCGFPLEVLRNARLKGFGANHNGAFARCNTELFCVLNPDIRIESDPFGALLDAMREPSLAAIAPNVIDPLGRSEDHARSFPTIWEITGKALGLSRSRITTAGREIYHPDWIAGMFVLFRSTAFAKVGGFDEGYFLYYEDVDICARFRELGLRVAVCPSVHVVHAARRSSHRDLRYSLRHARSAARFFLRRPAQALGLKRLGSQVDLT